MSLHEIDYGVLLLEDEGTKWKFRLDDVVSIAESTFDGQPDCWFVLSNKQQIQISKEDFDILDKNFCYPKG